MAEGQGICQPERDSQGIASESRQACEGPRIHALIRGRNCELFIEKCLRSLAAQTHTEWSGILILDAPKDNSEHVAREAIAKLGLGAKIGLVVRPERRGLSCNMYQGLKQIVKWAEAEDVCAIVDADDTIRKNAFAKVAKKYRKQNVWVTHGSYKKRSKGSRTRVSKPYPAGADVRKFTWRASHLKTFRVKLIAGLRPEHFQHQGKWLEAASDVALMLPIIEMAGLDRTKFIHRMIYNWRDGTKYATNRKLQIECEKIVRKKPKEKRWE